MTGVNEWIAEAQKRCDAATEGPWGRGDWSEDGEDALYDAQGRCIFTGESGYVGGCAPVPDVEFIAAARTDLPTALAALRAVLDEHPEVPDPTDTYGECDWCGTPYPCRTVRAIATALGFDL